VVVALVVAQTWLDWRDAKKIWVVPEWAKGMALAGAVACGAYRCNFVRLILAADTTSASNSAFNSRLFWPRVGLPVMRHGSDRNRGPARSVLRLMLILTGLLTAAFWIGMTIS